LHKPQVLVLDEPTNGLDPTQIESIRELIRRLGQTTTIILSTHIMQEVEAVCDRVLMMVAGKLFVDAPLSEIRDTHVIKLVLGAGATDVQKVLARVPGVTEANAAPRTDVGEVWEVRWHGDTAPVPGIIAAGTAAGWQIHAAAPEQRSLEQVFRETQRKHAQSQGGAR
jgi:ABC-2 type transport system ATP-binding protein